MKMQCCFFSCKNIQRTLKGWSYCDLLSIVFKIESCLDYVYSLLLQDFEVMNWFLLISPIYTIIHLFKNVHFLWQCYWTKYDRVNCFPNKFEQHPTCMKVFKLLAAGFIFPKSVQTFVWWCSWTTVHVWSCKSAFMLESNSLKDFKSLAL